MATFRIQAAPLETAAQRLDRKSVVASTLRSAQWRDVPQQIRDRAFFSSRVAWAQLLEREKDALTDHLTRTRRQYQGGEASVDRSGFIRDQRKFLQESGYRLAHGARGDVRDITSAKRLGMIFDVQTGHAKGFARRKLDNDNPLLLNAWPAKELVRVTGRKEPRDWASLWDGARASIPDPEGATAASSGRLAALKTCSIWTAISDFGLPYAPYKFGSGMGDRELKRSEAVALGILQPTATVRMSEQEAQDLNEDLSAAQPQDAGIAEALQGLFGGAAQILDGVIRFFGRRAS